MFLFFGGLGFALCILYFFFKRSQYMHHLKKFVAPPAFPILGHLCDFTNPEEALNKLLSYSLKFGETQCMHAIGIPFLVTCEPNLMETIMTSSKILSKTDEYTFLQNWLGNGLLTSTGIKWKNHRKILTPSFHYKILEEFVEVFVAQSNTLVKKFEFEIGNESFDCFDSISMCALDIICETAMGTTVNAQENPFSPYVKSVKTMCDITYIRSLSMILRMDFTYHLSKTYQRERKALKILRAFSNGVISKRKEVLLKNESLIPNGLDEYGVRNKTTFLDTLLNSNINGIPLTNDEIREEVDTFLFEGHDTTALAASFALYLLSKNLEIQEKAYEEIKNIYGNNENTTYEMLQDMKYLELIIKETLRLFPPIPIFSRLVTENLTYDGGILPKGLRIFMFPYGAHRNPKLFPEPEKFIPERFLVDNQANRIPFAYLPFSAGPRNCIGQKFAMLELKTLISKVLKHYVVLPATPEHTVRLFCKVTIQSANGIKIRLKKR